MNNAVMAGADRTPRSPTDPGADGGVERGLRAGRGPTVLPARSGQRLPNQRAARTAPHFCFSTNPSEVGALNLATGVS